MLCYLFQLVNRHALQKELFLAKILIICLGRHGIHLWRLLNQLHLLVVNEFQ